MTSNIAFEKLAGMSDEKVRQKTKLDWAQWCERLDEINALSMSHREIAKEIHTRWPEVGMWWTQTVTVGYERIRGLRAFGQQRTNKTYTASKSRTFAVSINTLFAAFDNEHFRELFLDAAFASHYRAAPKTMRFVRGDESVVATFIDKGPQKSAVAIEHLKLQNQSERARVKLEWSFYFDVLERLLEHQLEH